VRTPRQITLDILDLLGVDDASNRERARIAKIIYKTQVDSFTEALLDMVCVEERQQRWYDTTRKYGLNGVQT